MRNGSGPVGTDPRVAQAAGRIVARVRSGGDAALRALTLRFDGARRAAIEVGRREWTAGALRVERATHAALRLAAARIRRFARLQRRSIRPFVLREDGIVTEQRLVPIDSVGLYVPGGRHPLCSTVLMGAIPARAAGVKRLVVCTPPRPDGTIAPEILAAARLAGVDRVFAVGGAQAIAALAFGTRTVPAVDLIAGPGNAYVTAAKRIVADTIGIDGDAGPSELLLIADDSADPERAASDLLAQAEHDPGARLWLLAIGRGTAARIGRSLDRRLRALPAAGPNAAAARAAIRRMEVVRCAGPEQARRIADRIAPEHLAVQTRSARRLAARLRHYGSLFVGRESAVALGDYVTGPNHVLPTGGAARAAGGLSVHRFLKPVTAQRLTRRGAVRLAAAARRLAEVEGLEAHRRSIETRLPDSSLAAAVLFDFNGVLIEDETLHYRAFREVLAPLGIRLSRADYNRRYLVFDDRTALTAMLRDARIGRARSGPPTGLVARKRRTYLRLARRVRIDARAAAVVRGVAERAPVALVSGATRDEIVPALRRAGLHGVLRVIVAAEDVRRPKPAPDGYRRALRLLGLRSGRGSVAVEDSPGGVRAARAAGLAVIGVTTTFTAAALRRAGAARVAKRLASLTADGILGVALSAGTRRSRARRRSSRRRS